MKRLLVIMIAVSYLCLSVGIPVHIHYCMGKIVGASLVEHEDNHHCEKCGMDKTTSKGGCCKDEHKIFKTSEDQLLVKAFLVKANFTEFVPAPIVVFPQEVYITSVYENPTAQANAPPNRVPACPLYIRLRNLRV